MAFRTQKISQMTPKGSDLEATDLIEVSTIESGSYVTRSITGQEIIDAAVGNVDWGDIGGTLSDQTDLNTALSGKVPTTRTLTINGTTQDLSADRTFTISTGITIGTTAITSGTVGRVLFEGTGNVVQESANLFWDETNGRLGIGTNAPSNNLQVLGASGTIATVKINTANRATGMSFRYSDAGDSGSLTYNNIFYFTRNDNTFPLYLSANSNVLINTTTDAGYRLDVNGNTRINGDITAIRVVSSILRDGNNNAYINNSLINIATTNLAIGGTTVQDFTFTTKTSGGKYVFNNANVLINTTTDAGFRLDVNGTARVQGSLSLTAGNVINIGNVQALAPNTGNDLMVGFNNSLLTLYTSNNPVGRFFSTGNFAIGTTTDVASSKLTIQSTTQGFLPPRMTTTQKNAIATPATGLQVYDTTLNRPCFYDGTTWITL